MNAAESQRFAKPLRYSKYFEVRWAEFTFHLFSVVLRNWRTSIHYFQTENLNVFLNRWLLYDRIYLLRFLTDLLGILKSYQKLCQSNHISMIDLIQIKQKLLDELRKCELSALEGGWEEHFLANVVYCEGSINFFGHTLTMSTTGRRLTGSTPLTIFKRKHIVNSLI